MRTVAALVILLTVGAPSAAAAMTHPMGTVPGGGMRAAPVDLDEGLERLAAAGTRGDRSNAKPAKSVRGILKDDPYLRAAYAYLDNK